MDWQTTDLCDTHEWKVHVAAPIFRSYGGKSAFHGRIATLKIFEDNGLVRQKLDTPGESRVLVIDGGGSLRCALLGDQLAGKPPTHADITVIVDYGAKDVPSWLGILRCRGFLLQVRLFR